LLEKRKEIGGRESIYKHFNGPNIFWSERVTFFDPFLKERDVRFKDVMIPDKNYWAWDKFAIQRSDIVFCYLQKTNPGIGLFLELGYAYALGKTVILVIEKGNGEEAIPDRYREECRAFASATFYSFKEGLTFLESLL
jgi:nucleoside 2-deoxyribosyltransferase